MIFPSQSMPVPKYVSASEQSQRQQIRSGSHCNGALLLGERDMEIFNAAADDLTPPNAALIKALQTYRRKTA